MLSIFDTDMLSILWLIRADDISRWLHIVSPLASENWEGTKSQQLYTMGE